MSNIDIKGQSSKLIEIVNKDREDAELELRESLKVILPKDMSEEEKDQVTKELVIEVDAKVEEGIRDQYKANLVTFSSITQEGSRVKIQDYLLAVKFVTYRNSGMNIIDAYKATKRGEVAKAKAEGITDDQIMNRAKSYSQTKLVKSLNKIGQTQLHIVYGDYIIDGVERMHKIIMKGSDKNAIDAFGALTKAIMPKEDININIGDSAIETKVREMTDLKRSISVDIVHKVGQGTLSIDDILTGGTQDNILNGECVDVISD